MNRLVWIGIALLGAAGAAIIVSTATAQTIPALQDGTPGPTTAGQRSQMQSAVLRCWPYSVASLEKVCLRRGDGAQASTVFVEVSGQRTMTRDEIIAELTAGRTVKGGGKLDPETFRCALAGARLTAAQTFASDFWSGPWDTLRELCAERVSGQFAVVTVNGIGNVDVGTLADRVLSGTDVQPVGVVVP